MKKEDLTPNEQQLMSLLHFKSRDELQKFLSQPDNQDALARVGPPDEVYEDLQRAEEESDRVENLERLYRMSPLPS